LKKQIKIIIIILSIVIIGLIILISKENSKVRVCLDAGHGGEEVGAVLGKRYEKDDTLKVTKLVEKKLKKKNVKVIMTRTKDKDVSLEERCIIANQKKADIFVSIHRNSATVGNGIEIWCGSLKEERDTKLADNILTNLTTTKIQQNRGIKYGSIGGENSDYYVLKNTNMPSCLIELGFISNEKDNQLLDDNLEEYAEAIAEGILKTIENEL
jgi:N-acetylmuramoyl-L-alanine amidase